MRIMTKDSAGVLSKITSFLKNSDISIEKILQLPENNNNKMPIPIIIFTHNVRRDKIIKAIDKIENQDFVLEKIIFIPVDKS